MRHGGSLNRCFQHGTAGAGQVAAKSAPTRRVVHRSGVAAQGALSAAVSSFGLIVVVFKTVQAQLQRRPRRHPKSGPGATPGGHEVARMRCAPIKTTASEARAVVQRTARRPGLSMASSRWHPKLIPALPAQRCPDRRSHSPGRLRALRRAEAREAWLARPVAGGHGCSCWRCSYRPAAWLQPRSRR